MMQTRIILDTNIIRHFIDDSFDFNISLIKGYKPRLLFSISDLAFAELALHLYKGFIAFDIWRRKARILNRFLQSERPICPGGEELALLSGLKKSPLYKPIDSKNFYQASWQLLKNVRKEDDLVRGHAYRDTRGKNKIFLYASASKNIQDARNKWINTIEFCLDEKRNLDLSNEEIDGLLNIDLPEREGYSKGASKKLDASWRFLSMCIKKSIYGKYNPRAKNNKNDGLDHHLLFTLSIPAIVCSNDYNFIKKVKATNSPQSNLVITGSQLDEHLTNHTLHTLL